MPEQEAEEPRFSSSERRLLPFVRRRGDVGVHRRAAVRVQTVTIYQPVVIAGVPTHPTPVHVDRMVGVRLWLRPQPGVYPAPSDRPRQSVGRAVGELGATRANPLPP